MPEPVTDEYRRIIPVQITAAKRCMEDLGFLTKQVLFSTDAHLYGPLHDDMFKLARAPEYAADKVGKISKKHGPDRSLYLYPRGHFKTTVFTVAKVVQEILCNPAIRILILSAKDEHALTMSDQIKSFFVSNERLKALFSPWCLDKEWDSRSEWTTPARSFFGVKTKREPTVVASGFKSKLASKHYDLIILDDPIDEDDTTELGIQESLSNYGKVVPLLDMGGRLLVVGTRYHYNDLYQHLMDSGVFEVWVRHALEIRGKQCERDECARFAKPHNHGDFKLGEPIAPTLFTRKELENRLREYESDPKRGSSMFWHQYMNIPFSPTDRRFQPAWFVKVDDSMIPGQHHPFYPLNKWVALDSAWKDDEHPSGYDFTVIVVGGFDDQGRLYILDILRSKDWTMKQGSDALVTCMKSYGISRVITEKVGQVTFHTYFRDRCRQAGIPVQLITPKRGGAGSKGKFERIMSAQGYFEQGRVYFRKDIDNYDDCVNEFCNLGRWTNDDIADAIADFFDEQVKVLAPNVQTITSAPSVYHPMPYEGGQRRAMFAQVATATKKSAPRSEEIPVGMTGNFSFEPRPQQIAASAPSFFRPMRGNQ